MAHPYHHSLSSSKAHGVSWETHYPLHAFLDSSKELMADPRHRGLHHHQSGIELASKLFEASIPHAREIATQHVLEDLGFVPELEEWLPQTLDPLPPNPRFQNSRERILTETMCNLNGCPKEAIETILDLLLLPKERGLRKFLHFSAHGPFLCERKLGTLLPKTTIPTRYATERVILTIHGKIPTLQDIFQNRPIEDWMYVKASPLSKTLGEDPTP
jgi:hypothetical protein